MDYQFYTCDVFTDTRFGGNPLAVFPDARGLSAEMMQKIAREFNYSESTFVFPAEQGNTRRVRIFTPTIEVPFAGHPNVGTAFVLASIGELGEIDGSAEIVFEEDAGLVPITIRKKDGQPIWCELKAPQPVQIGQELPLDMMASALTLSVDDFVTTTHSPQVASVGLPFVIAELKDRATLERAQTNIDVLHKIEAMGIAPDIHVYVKSDGSADVYDIRCRMFAPLDNVPEDPATGSANCALVGMLTVLNSAENGTFSYHIAQGFEMGRPSILDARTEKRDGTVTGVWIAGTCVMVTEGILPL